MKENSQNQIELLLNKIYQEPDLGEELFEYVNPYVLKTYALLKTDSFNKDRNEQSCFKNKEDFMTAESILFKDLPGIVEVYTHLPLKYRNEHKLKTGKTHRDTLLDSIQKLVNKLKELDYLQYEEKDTEAIVKSKLIDQKYGQNNIINLSSELCGEPEPELKFQSNFNWNMFKKTLPTVKQEDLSKVLKNPMQNVDGYINNKEHRIKVQEGEIKYQVKDKMKHFMAGVYQVSTKMLKETKKVGKKIIAKHSGKIVLVGAVSGVVWFVSYMNAGYHAYNTFEDSMKYVGAGSDQLREINLKVLNELSKKDKNFKYTLGPNKELIFIEIKADKRNCEHVLGNIEMNYPQSNLPYRVNDILLNAKDKTTDEVKEAICSLDKDNKINAAFYTKKR